MAITTDIVTPEAQMQFNSDIASVAYTSAEFKRYIDDAGWQSWMKEYTDAACDTEMTETECKNIEKVQRKMWEDFWQKAAAEIDKAETEYSGEFVKKSDVDWKNCKFKLNGEEYEYTDREYNGEYYHGWNVKTKEDYAVRPVSIELEEDEWVDLGYVVYRWEF